MKYNDICWNTTGICTAKCEKFGSWRVGQWMPCWSQWFGFVAIDLGNRRWKHANQKWDRKHKKRRNKCKKRESDTKQCFKNDMFAILGKLGLNEKPLSVVLVWQLKHGEASWSYAATGAFSCGNKHILQGQVTMHLRTTLLFLFFQCFCVPVANSPEWMFTWEAGKTQYIKGALWDIGIVFRSWLYRFSVVRMISYDMVIHKSERYIYIFNCNCLCSWLPVHIMGSCSMQAMCGRLAVDITAHTKTWGKPFGARVLL